MKNIPLRDFFAATATDLDVAPYLNDYNNLRQRPAGNNTPGVLWQATMVPTPRTREAARYLYADAMLEQREKK